MWHTEQAVRRARELAFVNLIGLLASLVCLPLDYSVGPRMFETGFALRLGIVVPAYLLAIYAALNRGWLVQRWTSIMSTVCFAGVATYLGLHAGGEYQSEYLMGAALVIMVASVVMPLRPLSIAVMVALSLATMWLVLLFSPAFSTRNAVVLLGYISVLSIMGLSVPFRTARLRDRNFLYALRGRFAAERLVAANEQLRELSHRDDLTGLPNRRYFERIFHTAFQAAVTNGDELAVMMIDVDHFKQFNDTYGHIAGDHALRQVARELEKQFLAPDSTVARYGGEEFVVVVENCSEKSARDLADRARGAVARQPVALDIGERVPVTISIGVALRKRAALSADALVECADAALYAAKTSGRNIVRLGCDGSGRVVPPLMLEKGG